MHDPGLLVSCKSTTVRYQPRRISINIQTLKFKHPKHFTGTVYNLSNLNSFVLSQETKNLTWMISFF